MRQPRTRLVVPAPSCLKYQSLARTAGGSGARLTDISGTAGYPYHPAVSDRATHCDTRVVASRAEDRRMNILLDCAWCGVEVVFSVNETDDELVCSACNTRMDFAPDPATTFGLLYESAQAA